MINAFIKFDYRKKNMLPAQNSGKHSTSTTPRKACHNLRRAQEKMQPVQNTGKPLQNIAKIGTVYSPKISRNQLTIHESKNKHFSRGLHFHLIKSRWKGKHAINKRYESICTESRKTKTKQ